MRGLGLVLVAACSSSEPPDWAAPPAAVVAQCRYEVTRADPYTAANVLHFDANGRVVQIDNIDYDGAEPIRASWVFVYDDQGRLARLLQHGEEVRAWTYAANEVVVTGRDLEARNLASRYELDDRGRVTFVTTPFDDHAYAYDEAGRLARDLAMPRGFASTDFRYTYDDHGRVVSAFDVAYAYAEQGRDLRVTATTNGMTRTITLYADDQSRLARVAQERVGTHDFLYGDGWRERRFTFLDGTSEASTATGACPPEAFPFAPPLPTIDHGVVLGTKTPGYLYAP